MDAVCKASLLTGQSHFFYGGKPGVAQTMTEVLSVRYPGLRVAGMCSPPWLNIGPDFRLLGACREDLEAIRASNADIIWVGISSPKQEYWIAKAARAVDRGVFIGVGAAFDFHSGNVRRAPLWMRNNGLEWFHRLINEPRRLWRRYRYLRRCLFLGLSGKYLGINNPRFLDQRFWIMTDLSALKLRGIQLKPTMQPLKTRVLVATPLGLRGRGGMDRLNDAIFEISPTRDRIRLLRNDWSLAVSAGSLQPSSFLQVR